MEARLMSASVTTLPNFNLASIRETPAPTSGSLINARSAGRRDSFSQMVRRNSGDQRSSRADRSHESDKKDKKPAKKDDETNSATATDAANNRPEERRVPITFLLGLAGGQFGSFDTKDNRETRISQFGAKSGGTAAENGANILLPPQAQNITLTNSFPTESSEKSDPSAAKAEGTELLGIGESGNNPRGSVGVLSANALAFAMRLGTGGQALSASKTASSADPVSGVASDEIQPNFAAATPNAIEAASGSTLEENTHQHDESGQAQNVVDLSTLRTREPFDTTKLAEDHATAPSAQISTEPPVIATAE